MADFVQNFDWGSLLWFIEPGNLEREHLSVGLATFTPGKGHTMRSRSREEQILYVVSGTGLLHTKDNTETLEAGRVLHHPPYADIELSNDSDEELRLLVVYSPSHFHNLALQRESNKANAPDEADTADLDLRTLFDAEAIAAIRAVMDRLSEALGLSLSLLDIHGKGILKTDNHPVICSCLAEKTSGRYCQEHLEKIFQSLAALPLEDLNKPQVFYCCHNIASTIIPVVYHQKIQAYMKCGEIFLTSEDKEQLREKLPAIAEQTGSDGGFLLHHIDDIPIEPKSRLYSAAEATYVIANTIMGMVAQASHQRELNESRLSLAREQLATATLEKALHEADLKLLQSQVTPHFLFNTLSTIAQMAYLEGAPKAAKLTWSLADLLRATLRKTEERISISEEISLLHNYLHIQESRFGDRLSFEVVVDPEAETLLVPCMLFQPLIENAIIHGFESVPGKGRISLRIRKEGSWLRAVIKDNGAGFDVHSMVSNPKKIGLRSTWSRLEHYFGKNYTFDIDSRPGTGCTITVAFQTSEGKIHD